MAYPVSILSSREIAIALWSLVLIVWGLSINGIRKNLWGLFRKALFSKLILVWLSLAAYSALVILVLEKLGVWTTAHIKDTVVWFAFVAVTYPVQFHDPEKVPRVLPALLRESLSILLIAEVLVHTYTFSLAVEMILVPLVTLIAIMAVVAEMREQGKLVAGVLRAVQAIIGLVLLSIVVLRATADSDKAFVPALLAALIVVALSVASYPYVQGLRLAFAYEAIVLRFGRRTQVSRWFQYVASFQVLRHLKWRATAVASFLRRNAFALSEVVDRASLKALLDTDAAALGNHTRPQEPAG